MVVSNSQAAGVAHAVAIDAVALDTDTQGVQVQWSENATADSFAKNQIIARCEGRFATSFRGHGAPHSTKGGPRVSSSDDQGRAPPGQPAPPPA